MPTPQADAGKWMLTLTVMLGTMLNAIDTSIVNVAVPYMRGNLGASVEEISWVVTGYILSNVIVMPLIAMISTRFGRRRYYLFSVAAFTATSLLCALATTLPMLVAARVLQGIAGGSLAPLSQSIIRERFAPHEQGTAMGIFGLGVVIGPALGPTLGGWLVDRFSWPWIFYVNLPLGLLNVAMVLRYLHDPPYLKRERVSLDLPGVALLVLGLGSLQLMLEEGERNDWFSFRFITGLLFIAFTALALFAWRELTTPSPAVDLTLLGDAQFTSGVLISGMLGMGLFASTFLLPIFLQQLMGYPAFDAGVVMVPRSLAMGLTMPLAGRLYNRVGPRFLVSGGLLLSAASFLLMTRLSLDVGYRELFLVQAVQGMGFGMTFVSVSTATLASVPRPRMMAASGLYNVFRQVFGSIGIAWAANLLVRGQAQHRVRLADGLLPYSERVAHWLEQSAASLGARYGSLAAKVKALHLLDNLVQRQASMLAFNRVYLVFGVMLLAALPLVLLMGQGGRVEKPEGNGMVLE
ncbi:DHA2 family efflux MFS transporter permease subunit [Geomonas subterranea]|uniref:DHA2 family efflux MFS transporter permease subunit n=1 Tax=Geomonas subterranea TaxID=2847989 RepID=UPI001CD40291|nr:DHA2 family efflux MFS transporter permease subunit [Geomonas fuzhouensis]